MGLSNNEVKELEETSRKMRLELFDLSRPNGGYHFGGSLSCIDALVSLYDKVMKPEDKFILSKGYNHKMFANIKSYFPKNSQETRYAFLEAYNSGKPSFIRLKRDKKVK